MILRHIALILTFTGYASLISADVVQQSQVVFESSRFFAAFAPIPIDGNCDAAKEEDVCAGPPGSSFCDNGKCRCRESHAPKPDNSTCLVRIGGTCSTSRDCVSFEEDTAAASCTHNVCQCNDGYARTLDFTKCLKVKNNLYDDCEDSVQCKEGRPGPFSECAQSGTRKICNCTANTVHETDGHVCYERPKLIWDRCQVQVQCEILKARCTGNVANPGVCACEPGYVMLPNATLCVEVRRYEEACVDDVQCIGNSLQNAKCLAKSTNPTGEKVCQCDTGYVESSNPNPIDKKCLKKATVIGEPCIRGERQCEDLPDSICPISTGATTCQCDSAHVESTDKKRCLQREYLGGSCTESQQCNRVTNAECPTAGNPRTCQCKSGFVGEAGTSCWSIVREINQRCERPVQCTAGLGPLSNCRDNICQCNYFYGYYEGTCYIPSSLGRSCSKTEECYVGVNENSWCPPETKRCDCVPGTKEMAGKCWEHKTINSTCNTDAECNAWIIGGHAYCESGKKACACKNGYKSDNSGTLCSSSTSLNSNYYSFVAAIVIASVLKISFRT